MFDHVLSAGEQRVVENYLATRWGVGTPANMTGGALGTVGLDTIWTGGKILFGNAGNETLTGGTSTANNTFYGSATGTTQMFGGTGNDVFFAGNNSTIAGGAGADLIAIANGRAGGTVQVLGFEGADRVTLQGFGANELTNALGAGGTGARTVVAGQASSSIVLTGGTRIDFVGVTSLNTSNFV